MLPRYPNTEIGRLCIWSSFSSAYFVPLSDIQRCAERPTVSHALDQLNPLPPDRNILLERVLATATRLYCVLLYMGQLDSLPKLLSVDFTDDKLPVSDESILSDLKGTIGWNQSLLDRFLEVQWLFSAPYFAETTSILTLLPKMPIPLIYEASEAKIARRSTLKQVQIHESHQGFSKPNEIVRPMLALKTFKPEKKRHFEKELEVLQILNERRSNHVIKLLASFSSCDIYCMLFAWAEANLQEFLSRNASSREGFVLQTWILSQMTGLAQGLSVIHEFTKFNDGTVVYGRHGDLHPQNILLVRSLDEPNPDAKGTLQLSSMSEVQFFQSPEAFNTPRDTGSYEAPECQLDRTAGPSYDIWSLGCIFLEIFIWLSEGPKGLQQFRLARLDPDPIYGDSVLDDYFFSLQTEGRSYVSATVRPHVKSWIHRCMNNWEASHIFREVIDIVNEHMLQPCPDRRLASNVIHSRLQKLCDDVERAGMHRSATLFEDHQVQ